MKFMEKLKKAKKDNKGFSLVELIIVIAIMAILVGIVGTQVIPYINRSKEAKDLQIVNSYSTAAMTAYGSNAEAVGEAIDAATGDTIEFTVYGTYASGTIEAKLASQIQDLTYKADAFDADKLFSSTAGKTIADIKITITIPDTGVGTITTQAIKTVTGSEAPEVFDAIESKM